MSQTLIQQVADSSTDSVVPGQAWHALTEERVKDELECSLQGLSSVEARLRLENLGKNRLPARKGPSLEMIFLHQFASPLIYILIAAGLVSLAIKDVTDALFIFGVILFNSLLGTYQEYKAEQSAEALQSLLKLTAHVKRDGHEQELEAELLVPGDIVFLESGKRIPADIRLVRTTNLSVIESLLTGESQPIEKNPDTVLSPIAPLGDRINMEFAGTTVTSGRGMGIVVATGLQTEVGKIAKSVRETAIGKTPLLSRMESFSRNIALVFSLVILTLAILATIKGYPLNEVFMMAVALAVAAIPEGLPVAMTVALSIGSRRMARRNVIVRKLMAVEGLGSCTYIASDKTGTLTVNKQTVKLIMTGDQQRFHVTGDGYNGEGTIELEHAFGKMPSVIDEKTWQVLETIARSGVLCNDGNLYRENGQWLHEGDPVDVAFLAMAYKAGLTPQTIRRQMQIVGEIPYESERQFAAKFYKAEDRLKVAVKGAGERLLPYCRTRLTPDGVQSIDSSLIEQLVNTLAEDGYRVILVAEGDASESMLVPSLRNEEELPSLTLLGLIGMIDPFRQEAREAIAACHHAGIKVAMVTGDHPATAMAIARQLGIVENQEAVVTGTRLEQWQRENPEKLKEHIAFARVFARVTPLHKLKIVETLREVGHFVAVTGDGVNDTPALRAANIGVAMGSGSDIAKDTAMLIITDDNFASIEAGIEEGRFAYDNVRKVIYLVLSSGAAEIILVTLSLLVNLPIPLFAAQLLWLNIVTNGIQDVALAFEAGEPGALQRPPRNPKQGIFDRLMIQENLIAGLAMGLISFGFWFWQLDQGVDEFTARNELLLLMVLLENIHVFNCRSEYRSAFRVPLKNNVVLIAGVLLAQGIHILSMYIPVMEDVLSIAPVSLPEWGRLLLLALSVLVVMEVFKAVRQPKRYSSARDVQGEQTVI